MAFEYSLRRLVTCLHHENGSASSCLRRAIRISVRESGVAAVLPHSVHSW
jgi:hypothetical protein